jgi:hypothetical protein
MIDQARLDAIFWNSLETYGPEDPRTIEAAEKASENRD